MGPGNDVHRLGQHGFKLLPGLTCGRWLREDERARPANFGPLHDDYGTGCGGTDGTIHGNCGVGYFRITNGHAHITRGTESGDNRWDGFTVETYADPDGLPWVGFRCAYLP